MGLKKKGSVWHGRLWVHGKEISRSLRTSNKQVAERRLVQMRDELWKDPRRVVEGPLLIRHAMDQFLRGAERTRQPSTVERYNFSNVAITSVLGDIEAPLLSRRDIARFIEERREEGVSDATIRRDLTALSAMYQWLVRSGRIDVNPVRAFDKQDLGNSEPRVRYLEDEVFNRLLYCLGNRVNDLVPAAIFAAETGLRLSEQFALTRDNIIMFNDGRRGVVVTKSKNKKQRTVPLTGVADQILDRVITGTGPEGHLFSCRGQYKPDRGQVYDPFVRAVADAGIEDFHWHDLRHQAATRWRRAGMSLDRIKDLLGHSSLAMVMRYAHLFPDDLSNAIAAFDNTSFAGNYQLV